mgnify:CR=1 FL=1
MKSYELIIACQEWHFRVAKKLKQIFEGLILSSMLVASEF